VGAEAPSSLASVHYLRKVVAGAGADGELFLVDGYGDRVVAAGVGIGGRVADVVLGVEFATDFVDGLLDTAVAKCGEVQAARGRCCGLQDLALGKIFRVLHGNFCQGGKVYAVHVRLVVRSGSGAGEVGTARDARRGHGLLRVWRTLILQFGMNGGEADAIDGDAGALSFLEDFAQFCGAADVDGFGDDHEDAASWNLIGGRLRARAEHFDSGGHGVVEFRAVDAGGNLRDGAFDLVGAGSEILELVDLRVEGHDGGFAARSEDSLREEDAGFADFRQQRRDTGTIFDQDDHGDGLGADVEVGDGLQDAVIGDAKIFGVQIVDHLAFIVADDHGGVDQGDLDLYRGLPRSLLDGDIRGRRHGAVGGLRAARWRG
jgi:hypothetical protein